MYVKTIKPPKRSDAPVEIRIGEDIIIQLRQHKDRSSLQLSINAPRQIGISVSQADDQNTTQS